MKYGNRLKLLVKEAGFGQNEFASKIGIAGSTMSIWCNAEYPPLEGIEKICNALDMPLYRFFMSTKDIEDFMGVDPEWLEMGKAIQPLSSNLKSFFYDAIYRTMKAIHVALKEAQQSD
jgi:transcriptional regulator with XRE-family HTH domain